MDQEGEYISVAQFAKKIGVSERTLWRMLARRRLIEPFQFGGNTRWCLKEVENWIERCRKPNASDN